jgi:pimeloyl-ACP methyl ester carboxylesterase
VRGHDLYYRDSASAHPEVMLLLHGFPTSSFDWRAMWDGLAARFRVIAPDLLGFGFSAKPPEERYTIVRQSDLVESLLVRLHISRVHLLAHDYGDTVAQELIARERDGKARVQIASACFLNGGLFPEAHRPRLVQRLLATRAGPTIVRWAGERGFKRSLAAVFGPDTQPSPLQLDEYWALTYERDGQLLLPALSGYMAERRERRGRWVGALQSKGQSLRFIVGLDDPVSGRAMAQRFRELVRDGDVVGLEAIGHYPHCEAPDAVLESVLQFHARQSR